jgi:D-alanyl-D-alanine carboxypeptidase
MSLTGPAKRARDSQSSKEMDDMSFLTSRARRGVVCTTAALTSVLLAAAGPAAYASAATRSAPGHAGSRAPARLQRAADHLVADGVPGVIIMTRRGKHVSDVVAGLADKATGQPMRPQDRVWIGSITKTFVATVVLQLAAEGRLSLNDSVQKWLPGVITGHGYHPAQITIRQLLQHTSGIPDYISSPGFLTPQSFAQTWQPRQLVDLALRLGPPVHHWLYSNTNYILLGMIIHKLTGHSPATEIRRRILAPLGLTGTSFPVTSKQIPAPYAHGYYGPTDVTNLVSPSVAWTSGAMISNVGDVARFYRALLTGQLLTRTQQRELETTIPVHDTGELFAEHYGLGIYRVQLPCGTAWGHDGGYPGGFKTFAYTSPNGSRQAVMVYNDFRMSMPQSEGGTGTPAFMRDVKKATEIAFCAQR